MSFSSESRERTRPVLPLASMVDIMFLLLIFFMTASVFREQEQQMPVNLAPAATAKAGVSRATRIVITITKDNRIFLEQRELPLPTLREKLTDLAKLYPHETVVIRGDEQARYGLAIRVMDTAEQAGLKDVRVATVRSTKELQ